MARSIRGRARRSNGARLTDGGTAALASALLFAAGAPAAKSLLGSIDSQLLAGLLYLSAGLTLSMVVLGRSAGGRSIARFSGRERRSLFGAVALGGVVAPVLLLWGLRRIPASSASLILILEAPLTALGAWLLFREHLGPRVIQALVWTTLGAAVIAGPASGGADALGAAAVAAACACWALDNDLTREVAHGDALRIAALKGSVGGVVNSVIALALGSALPPLATLVAAAGIGALCYGVSLVFYVLALRELGAARAGAYFATAPFLGATASVLLLGEKVGWPLAAAASLMAVGVWRLIGESHSHAHRHEAVEHSHRHVHDEHHRHPHAEEAVAEPHTHLHRHDAVIHQHPHAPDVHHRHEHDR